MYTEDGIRYQHLTKEYLEKVQDFMLEHLFPYENFCKICDVLKDSSAVQELKNFISYLAKDGISAIAVCEKNNQVLGAILNKIQIIDEKTKFSWCHNQLVEYERINLIIDEQFSFFKHFQIDCYIECYFGAVLQEFRNTGIAQKLIEFTMDIAKELNKGNNVKVPIDNSELSNEPTPKLVICICTSLRATKSITKIGGQIAHVLHYNDFNFENMNFIKCLDNANDVICYVYIRSKL